jgi:hypothetical protein
VLNQGRTKGWLLLLDLIKVACTASIRTLFSLIKISLFLCFKQVKTGQRNLRGSVFDCLRWYLLHNYDFLSVQHCSDCIDHRKCYSNPYQYVCDAK